jgi:D-arabinose 1-dehydrogenase-like Zn-dependent alcohol dehydrogenase
LGAHTVVFTTSPGKKEDALRLGADEVVISKLDFCRFLGISYEGRRISKDRTRADIRW